MSGFVSFRERGPDRKVSPMNTWFTSDQHFGHKNILTYSKRPFADVDEMTEELVRRHNERVRPGDVVYQLGDFSMSDRYVRPILERLNGRHILVPGNHDGCHSCHRGFEGVTIRYLKLGFAEVLQRTTLDFEGEIVKVEHLPYAGSGEFKEKYLEHRPIDDGGWLLHGHVHDAWKVRRRMINVGVDPWNYAPVHWDEILKIIRSGGAT